MIEKTCMVCSKVFKVYGYRSKTAKFCSQECRIKYIRENPLRGEQHPRWNRIKRVCMQCGREFWAPRNQVYRDDGKGGAKFCSRSCASKFYARKVLPKGPPGSTPWSEEEIAVLKKLYVYAPRMVIERALPDRNWNTIKAKANELGLKRANIYEKTRLGLINLAPVNLSDTDAAYIAGLIDGEGCITYREKYPKVSIYNTSKELIEWIQKTLGLGTIHLDVRRKGKERWKPCYTYGTSNFHDIYALLSRVLPYLKIKREKAIDVLRLIEKRREILVPVPVT